MNDEHQRITLQYTINLSELPREVERLQENLIEALDGLTLTKMQGGQILQLSAAQELETLRHRIVAADMMVADLGAIINSYLQLQVAPEAAGSTGEQHPSPRHATFDDRGIPHDMSPTTTIDDLNATLAQLKGATEDAPEPT
jgi:hypothetical protein